MVGAIGDTQEDKDGFAGINKEIILKDALESGNLEVKLGLRMFGAQTRPLYKILQFSTDPYIPGITGDEEASISFLAQINIDKDRKLIDLSEDEMKKLVAAIIIKRMGSETNPEDVLGNTYLLKDQPESSPTKDLKEFATLLNSCGRMHKPSLGIGTCLNDPESYENAVKLLVEYKQKLIDSLNWFHKNKDSSLVIETPELVLINAEENIPDTLIGTVTSMISKSNIYKEGTVLISLAHTLDSNTKISIRISGYKIPEGIDLKEDPTALQRLKEAAEKAKIALSSSESTEVNLPYVTADAKGPKHFRMTISRAQYENLVIDLIEKTFKAVDKAIKDSGISKSDIHEVIMVG